MRPLQSVSFLAHPVRQTQVVRYFLLCYLIIILLVSLFPFSGWTFSGAPPFAFLFYPLPHYFTVFDNMINVLAYIPVGLFWSNLRRPAWYTFFSAVFFGAFLSFAMEFIQQFLPNRVASNLDLLCNTGGALLGALLAVWLSSRYWRRLWLVWRHQYLAEGSGVEWGVAWLCLWFVTQLDPSQPFLGVVVEPRGLPQPFESPIENAQLFLRLLEGGGMMLNLIGVAMFVSVLVRYTWQVPAAIWRVLLLALLIKMAFAGMMLKPAQFFAWLNLNIMAGGLLGFIFLFLTWRLLRHWRAMVGTLALMASIVVSWMWPLNTLFSSLLPLFRWHYGHLQHISSLSGVIADLWPIGGVVWLAYMTVYGVRD